MKFFSKYFKSIIFVFLISGLYIFISYIVLPSSHWNFIFYFKLQSWWKTETDKWYLINFKTKFFSIHNETKAIFLSFLEVFYVTWDSVSLPSCCYQWPWLIVLLKAICAYKASFYPKSYVYILGIGPKTYIQTNSLAWRKTETY